MRFKWEPNDSREEGQHPLVDPDLDDTVFAPLQALQLAPYSVRAWYAELVLNRLNVRIELDSEGEPTIREGRGEGEVNAPTAHIDGSHVFSHEATLREITDQVMISTFLRTGRNKMQTAKILGVNVKTIFSNIKRIEESERSGG